MKAADAAPNGYMTSDTRAERTEVLTELVARRRSRDHGQRLRRTATETSEGSRIDDYVVEDHADHVLGTFKTQQEAIAWAMRTRTIRGVR